jgi:predicted component of type VI protein secretion system
VGPTVRTCAALAIAAVLIAGCGGEDFKNEARAPIRVALTGVIQDDAVTVSPSKVGAGPVEITISNQTDAARSITLEGDSITEREGPVAPGDTATIQKTLAPGSYEVKAGSTKAVVKEIRPAVLRIGKERKNSNNDLLLP